MSDEATLPWEIQKSHFSTLLLIYFGLFTEFTEPEESNNNDGNSKHRL